jgi:hypothetical protein
MRFIVDLYRLLIYFYCAAIIIAVALAIFLALDRSGPSSLSMDVILIGAAIFSIVILNLGGIAILVSFHDRHTEVAESLDRIAASLEKIGGGDAIKQGNAA